MLMASPYRTPRRPAAVSNARSRARRTPCPWVVRGRPRHAALLPCAVFGLPSGLRLDDLDLPAYDDVASALHRLQLGVDAGELHGALCGYLGAHGSATRSDWIARLEIDADGVDVAADPALDALFRASVAQLADAELGFALLLPPDEAPLAARVDALLGWCRGYLGGFGLGAGAGSGATLSPDAQEALQDIGRIAGFAMSEDDPERDEDAFAEVAEFVRVAALLLHADTARDAGARQRLH